MCIFTLTFYFEISSSLQKVEKIKIVQMNTHIPYDLARSIHFLTFYSVTYGCPS